MPIPDFIRRLRDKIGNDRLLVPTAGAVIYNTAGHVLFARHIGSGRWSFPGGIIEPLEPPADAIVREVWEETGLKVHPTRLVGVYGGGEFRTVYPNGDEICFVLTMFECTVRGGVLEPDAEEIDVAEYIQLDRILDLDVPAFMPIVLRDLRGGKAGAKFQAPVWSRSDI